MRAIRAALGGVISLWLVIVLTIAFFASIGVVIWWATTGTSGARGTAQITRDKNSGQNRETWNGKWTTLWADINADQARVSSAQKQADAHPGDEFYNQNFLGAQQSCLTDVAVYNADLANILAKDSVPDGQPTTNLSTTTYCGS